MEAKSKIPATSTVDQTDQNTLTEDGGYVSPDVLAAEAGERVEFGSKIIEEPVDPDF